MLAASPPSSIAALPGQLFCLFQGSGHCRPHLLPTTSANPSPPHIMATATTPAGCCRHASVVAARSIRTYARGPCRSSLLSPVRLTLATSLASGSKPLAVAIRRAALTTGTAAANTAAPGFLLQDSVSDRQVGVCHDVFSKLLVPWTGCRCVMLQCTAASVTGRDVPNVHQEGCLQPQVGQAGVCAPLSSVMVNALHPCSCFMYYSNRCCVVHEIQHH
jgi:hypothetical protein